MAQGTAGELGWGTHEEAEWVMDEEAEWGLAPDTGGKIHSFIESQKAGSIGSAFCFSNDYWINSFQIVSYRFYRVQKKSKFHI